VFDTLKKDVFPKLLKIRDKHPIRIWVLGCSTGQEAYSIAMALQETADKISTYRKFQIFATDLNETLLDKARRGLYAKSLADEISTQRLSRFFVEEEGGYRVNKALREAVIFAQQNLITDPPFSRMDMISCRNLMIYLEPSLQQKAVPTFHYALKQDGYLLLGASESISTFTHLFEPLTKKHKIFLRKPALSPVSHLPVRQAYDQRESAAIATARQGETSRETSDAPPGFHSELNALREADRVIINRFAPPGVLINNELEIMQFRGETSAYLKPPVGKAHFSILKMAREGLLLPLRAAINEAKKTGKTAFKDHIKLKQSDDVLSVNLEVIPLKNLREHCFLIVFHEMLDITDKGQYLAARAARNKSNREKSLSADEEANRIAELEVELSETQDYLQSMMQQHEAANEELQASSEEAQSANEELQSINEELETSKEELESANEELTTVNEEMGNRNTELNRLNNDLHNFQSSIRQVIILMNRDLTIRRFSKEAEDKFGLLATDIDRPISQIRHNLMRVTKDGKETPLLLEEMSKEVISAVHEQEHEVCDAQGNWYSLRLRPYMTHDNKVDGVVAVMLDITQLKHNEQINTDERDFAENMVNTLRQPLLMLDKGLNVVRANVAYYNHFGTKAEKTLGKNIFDLGHGQWDVPRLRELLEKLLPTSISINDFHVEYDGGKLGRRLLTINARRVQSLRRRSRFILLAIEDITDREAAWSLLRESERRYREMINAMPVAIYTTDADGNLVHFNQAAARLVGYTPDPVTAPKWGICWKMYNAEGEELSHEESPFATAVRENRAMQHVEYTVEQPGGNRLWCAVYPSPIRDNNGRVTGGINILLDISQHKKMEFQLEEQATTLADTNRRKDEFMAMLSHELRNPLAAVVNALQLVKEGQLNEIQDEAFGVIKRQSR
ncbi:MAG TPA: CheR family methyltransferase, partial [Gammaproteobacteria bacterium]|nr:CheR family methyltransferase [Gammaproteobacteria bacterium]